MFLTDFQLFYLVVLIKAHIDFLKRLCYNNVVFLLSNAKIRSLQRGSVYDRKNCTKHTWGRASH